MKTDKKPVMLAVVAIAAILLSFNVTSAQSINPNWKKDMNSLLQQFVSCAGASAESNYTCSSYIAESLAKIYKVGNVYDDKAKRYKLMNEMSATIDQPSQWKLLGNAYEQPVLDEAQTLANAQKAVVAVYKTAEGVKHIAVVLPGEMQFSGTWGFKVPNSASFVLNDPSKSYVEKGLSYAFTRSMIKDVKLYSKAY